MRVDHIALTTYRGLRNHTASLCNYTNVINVSHAPLNVAQSCYHTSCVGNNSHAAKSATHHLTLYNHVPKASHVVQSRPHIIPKQIIYKTEHYC